MEGFRELHNNTVPKKHDSQNNTPLNARIYWFIHRVPPRAIKCSCCPYYLYFQCMEQRISNIHHLFWVLGSQNY
jgi:hypothetical protein